MPLSEPAAKHVFLANRAADEQLDLETQFFSKVRLRNGTVKTTGQHRLGDVDRILTEYAKQARGTARILDVGISSGITTLEWISLLEAEGVNFTLDALDICIRAYIASWGNKVSILYDDQKKTLQFQIGNRVTSADLGHNLRSKIKRTIPIGILRLLFEIWAAANGSMFRSKEVTKGRVTVTPIQLLTKALQKDIRVNIIQDDLTHLSIPPKKYDLIRAANILNKAYFSDSQLIKILQSLLSYLRKDGKLMVVRTDDKGTNNGSVYASNGRRLIKVDHIGVGSEIDDLVESSSISKNL